MIMHVNSLGLTRFVICQTCDKKVFHNRGDVFALVYNYLHISIWVFPFH